MYKKGLENYINLNLPQDLVLIIYSYSEPDYKKIFNETILLLNLVFKYIQLNNYDNLHINYSRVYQTLRFFDYFNS